MTGDESVCSSAWSAKVTLRLVFLTRVKRYSIRSSGVAFAKGPLLTVASISAHRFWWVIVTMLFMMPACNCRDTRLDTRQSNRWGECEQKLQGTRMKGHASRVAQAKNALTASGAVARAHAVRRTTTVWRAWEASLTQHRRISPPAPGSGPPRRACERAHWRQQTHKQKRTFHQALDSGMLRGMIVPKTCANLSSGAAVDFR